VTILRLSTQMNKPLPAPTPASIAAALAYQQQARAEAGLPLDAQLTISPLAVLVLENEGYSLEHRVACGEAVDLLVETFGLPCVLRTVRAVAQMNERSL
jgi:hypothetical protein